MTSRHSALDAFAEAHQEIHYEADRIAKARAHWFGRRHTEQALQEARDFVGGPLLRHLYEEQRSLLAVIHEHLADQHPSVIERDERIRAELHEDLARVQRALETGKDGRHALKEMENCLRDYVQYEDHVLVPWVKENLGDALLREVDERRAQIQAGESAVTMTMKQDIDKILAQ